MCDVLISQLPLLGKGRTAATLRQGFERHWIFGLKTSVLCAFSFPKKRDDFALLFFLVKNCACRILSTCFHLKRPTCRTRLIYSIKTSIGFRRITRHTFLTTIAHYRENFFWERIYGVKRNGEQITPHWWNQLVIRNCAPQFSPAQLLVFLHLFPHSSPVGGAIYICFLITS